MYKCNLLIINNNKNLRGISRKKNIYVILNIARVIYIRALQLTCVHSLVKDLDRCTGSEICNGKKSVALMMIKKVELKKLK